MIFDLNASVVSNRPRQICRSAVAAAELIVSLCRVSYYLFCPYALGSTIAGKLEVSRQISSPANKVKWRATQGGHNIAMVDGSVLKSSAAIAVWYKQGHPMNASVRISGQCDNNRAELAALFWALLRHPRAQPFTIHTDSSYVIHVMRRLSREGPVTTSCLLTWCIAILVCLRTARTTVRKTKGHNGNPFHDMADLLAKLATKKEAVQAIPEGTCSSRLRRPFAVLSSIAGMQSRLWLHFLSGSAASTEAEPLPLGKARPEGKGAGGWRARPLEPLNGNRSVTNLLGLDCEMVGAGPGGVDSILARACVVNKHGNVLLDELAAPSRPVTDFRTEHSGIRPEDLEGAPPADEVRARVAQLIAGRVIVGHGIENDFAALGLHHPPELVQDTAAIPAFCYGRRAGRPRKLRDLARIHLGASIQEGEHSPAEDARAAVFLYRKFVQGLVR
uniref:RNA exonuclease 4 n=1 Tax=Tetraselmis sp. GSL018 TaxID=582737 RepID=A0A061SM62_9CHLO|mmetsp:Transcript_16656/g.39545  ORF Transcript_16656/g.39545 Transcript_16656/m.39545 type:complete len:446 (-) Transcript_16656:265-1602(-)